MRVWERFIGRSLIVTIIGLTLGYAIGLSVNRDAERGKALTREAYVAQFDEHKAHLEKSGGPMPLYVIIGVVMSVALFGVYEGLSWGAERVVTALGRSRKEPPSAATGNSAATFRAGI
jgi:amino acid transporter